MTRSTRLLAIGITVLALALVVALLAMRDGSDPIVVTDPDTTAAASTDDGAVTDGQEDVAATGTVGELAEDTERLPAPLEIPEGHEAVAITASYDVAVAGLPAPGDHVNVYGVFTNGAPEQLQEGDTTTTDDEDPLDLGADAAVARVLPGVEVLGVSGVEPGVGGGTVTLVLALEPADAERAIYLAGVERVWFSLVTADHEPVDGEGVTRDTVLGDALG